MPLGRAVTGESEYPLLAPVSEPPRGSASLAALVNHEAEQLCQRGSRWEVGGHPEAAWRGDEAAKRQPAAYPPSAVQGSCAAGDFFLTEGRRLAGNVKAQLPSRPAVNEARPLERKSHQGLGGLRKAGKSENPFFLPSSSFFPSSLPSPSFLPSPSLFSPFPFPILSLGFSFVEFVTSA